MVYLTADNVAENEYEAQHLDNTTYTGTAIVIKESTVIMKCLNTKKKSYKPLPFVLEITIVYCPMVRYGKT